MTAPALACAAWSAFGRLAARMYCNALLYLVYYLLLTPMGAAKRLLKGSPGGVGAQPVSWWKPVDAGEGERYERQF